MNPDATWMPGPRESAEPSPGGMLKDFFVKADLAM